MIYLVLIAVTTASSFFYFIITVIQNPTFQLYFKYFTNSEHFTQTSQTTSSGIRYTNGTGLVLICSLCVCPFLHCCVRPLASTGGVLMSLVNQPITPLRQNPAGIGWLAQTLLCQWEEHVGAKWCTQRSSFCRHLTLWSVLEEKWAQTDSCCAKKETYFNFFFQKSSFSNSVNNRWYPTQSHKERKGIIITLWGTTIVHFNTILLFQLKSKIEVQNSPCNISIT